MLSPATIEVATYELRYTHIRVAISVIFAFLRWAIPSAPKPIAGGEAKGAAVTDEHIRFTGKSAYGSVVGKCIYCGSVGSESEPLSDEHIVPYSLGADAVLEKASCAGCAKITSYLEGYTAKEIFGPLRSHFKVQSRRKTVKLNDVEVTFVTDNGNRTQRINRADLPALLFLPILEPAGKFYDRTPAPLATVAGWMWSAGDLDERMKKFKRPGDKGYSFVNSFKADIVARAVAKIAHTLAVARLGLGSFELYLPAVILGKDPNIGFLIGARDPPANPTPLPVGTTTTPHNLTLRTMKADDGPPILVVSVHLFPFTGAPSYNVIVGEPGREALKELEAEEAGNNRGMKLSDEKSL